MKITRERLLMGLLFVGLPAGLHWMVIRPSARRMEVLRQRIRTADGEARHIPPFTAVGPAEKAFLENPKARWRTRIATLATDADRLAQVNRVVGEVHATLKARGVSIASLKIVSKSGSRDPSAPLGRRAHAQSDLRS